MEPPLPPAALAAPTLRWHHLMAVALLAGAAVYVRLLGLWWDGGASLHADERFLLMVLQDMQAGLNADPGPIWQWYFDGAASPLNPHRPDRLYVYGEWPVMVLGLLGHVLQVDGWGETQMLGRTLSALLDTAVVPMVFAATWTVLPRVGPALCAATLYAAAPMALQHSVFLTVDSWLTAASALCGLCLLKAIRAAASPGRTRRAIRWIAAAGAAAGLAAACKLPGILLTPAILVGCWAVARQAGWPRGLLAGGIGIAAALVAFRLTSPYLFLGPGLLGVFPNPETWGEFARVAALHSHPDFPPNWQWQAGYGLAALLRDAALFAVGPAVLLALSAALAWPALLRLPALALMCLAALALAPLAFAASVDTPILRYLAPAMPPAAILAGLALARRRPAFAAAVVGLALWWGAGMVRLHTGVHPRIAATAFLAKYPVGVVIANETAWDEGLPATPWWGRLPGVPEDLDLRTLDLTAPDSGSKAAHMATTAAKARLIAVTSGRQRDHLTRLPDRFPMVRAWYEGLESGAFCYRRVFHIDRGYPLPGVRLPDGWAQESWRVFDHPIVSMYERQPCHDPRAVEAALRAALPPED